MTLMRLTDLSSTNEPRPGSSIEPGDVVFYTYVHALKGTVGDEGVIQESAGPLADYAMRPVFAVRGADGLVRYPLHGECLRVDPAPVGECVGRDAGPCTVVGCIYPATHRGVLAASFSADARPYTALLCDDHAGSDEGRSYRRLSVAPLSASNESNKEK